MNLSKPLKTLLSSPRSVRTLSKMTNHLSKVTTLPPAFPKPADTHPAHWLDSTPSGFQNPWPSFSKTSQGGFLGALKTKLGIGRDNTFVPTPENISEIFPVRRPYWTKPQDERIAYEKENAQRLKATWLGHAAFLVEMPRSRTSGSGQDGEAKRGVTILMDAVFGDRMSPVSFAGPKRFTQPPCKIEELPPVDVMLISHNHYDHLDIGTVKAVFERNRERIHFCVPLGMKEWFTHEGIGVPALQVTELDWWERRAVEVEIPAMKQETSLDGAGSKDTAEKMSQRAIRLTCCPSQHFSARSLTDRGKTLWCSWAIEEILSSPIPISESNSSTFSAGKTLYFAGDTAYKSHNLPSSVPPCPSFAQVPTILPNRINLSLLPIGCYKPEAWMTNVHASPSDSLAIHRDLNSEKSIGMHYGMIRGGISGQYETVVDGREKWERVSEEDGGRWSSGECGVVDIGGTVCV